MTKLVVGRDAQTKIAINMLWTIGASAYPDAGSQLCISHFVAMIPVVPTTSQERDINGISQDYNNVPVEEKSDTDMVNVMCPVNDIASRRPLPVTG